MYCCKRCGRLFLTPLRRIIHIGKKEFCIFICPNCRAHRLRYFDLSEEREEDEDY
ncbi:MAG: hypothetical protein KBS41_02365 [Oscillospiraceae bacterium]|nr:hypothetical protein [Candidatus Equicaccousia limihippi]